MQVLPPKLFLTEMVPTLINNDIKLTFSPLLYIPMKLAILCPYESSHLLLLLFLLTPFVGC